jgi:uncharacterized membrane protein
MHAAPATLNFSRSGPYFAALLAVALLAFWPSYVSRPLASSPVTHFHAFTATLWMLMLIVQPLAIRKRRLTLHRALGRVSYILAPLVVISMLLLAHDRIRGLTGARYAFQTYILYLQLSLALLFAVAYTLAIVKRRVPAVHARFMICTALTLVDPIAIRLLLWMNAEATWNYQWATYAATDVALIVMIWFERHARTGRAVFPAMLLAFVLSQIPALAGWTEWPAWQAFSRWFAGLAGV